MHRLKMPMILIAGLIGLVAIVFGLVNTSNNAEATDPVPGPPGSTSWKNVGTVVSVKKSGTGTEWVLTLTATTAKAALLTKGDAVIVVGSAITANNYTPTNLVIWRVLSIKPTPPAAGPYELRLTKAIPGECQGPPVPVDPGAYSGPECVKPVVGGGNAADLSGVSDLIVDAGNPNIDIYHCMFRTDIDAGGDVKSAAHCFDNTGALGTGGKAEPINSLPGEGTTNGKVDVCDLASVIGGTGDSDCIGPPPPPPYAVTPPSKGAGTYTGDNISINTCFADVGSSVNIIATTTITGAHAQLAATGKQTGTTLIYSGQTNAACDALAPTGTPGNLAFTIYPATNIAVCQTTGPGPDGDCVQAPYRLKGDVLHGYPDWDQDGCDDSDELWQMKPGVATKCGDDPWNPFDVMTTDASGTYSLTAIAARQDVGVPGFYYDCQADINQSSKVLTAKVACYIDSPLVVVNPKAVPAPNANATTCGVGAAPAQYCGDGISGAPPPGNTVGTYPTNARLFAKIGAKHTELTGVVDNVQNVIKLEGCFESNIDNAPVSKAVGTKVSFTGNIYVRAVINLHTGHGQVNLWTGLSNGLTNAQCLTGATTGAGGVIPVHIVRQAAKATPPAGRDTDGDGCPNKRELSDTQGTGGLRDPLNHYDYMNPTKDGLNRVDDILAVVNQYFIDDPVGNPDMKSQTDRTAIPGANPWNLGPPNGLQRVDDILASVKQYFHDC